MDAKIDPLEGVFWGTGDPLLQTAAPPRKPRTAAGPRRRSRAAETFARIPHEKARELFRHRISTKAWLLLIELDRLILKGHGGNPVKLTSEALRGSGLSRWQRDRALSQLAGAGVIAVERGSGRCSLVTHLWYPIS
jgi:hypothetical protein